MASMTDGADGSGRRDGKGGARNFVGRTEERALFGQRLEATDPWNVLDIRGRHGIGRTALAYEFAEQATASGWTVLQIGSSHRELPNALGELVTQLPRLWSWEVRRRRRAFLKRRRRWLELSAQLPEMSSNTIDVVSTTLRATAGVAGAAFGGPVAGAVASPLADAGLDATTGVVRHLNEVVKGEEDLQMMLDCKEVFSTLLADLVSAVADRQDGILIIIDDIDESAALDPTWPFEFVVATHRDFPANVIVATTSELGLPLSQWSPDHAELIKQIKLGAFSPDETADYLRSRNIVDRSAIDTLQQMSGGHIGRLESLATVHLGVDEADVIDWPLIQPHLDLVRAAALVRQFDRDVLGEALGAEPSDEQWRWLVRNGDITQQHERTWSLARHYRTVLSSRYRTESPQQFKAMNEKLAEWYGGAGADRTRAWAERCYHSALANGLEGAGRVLGEIDPRFNPDQLRAIADAASDAAAEVGEEDLERLALGIKELVAAAGAENWAEAADAAARLREVGLVGSQLLAKIAGWRALMLDLAGNGTGALAELEQSITGDPGEPYHRAAHAAILFTEGRYAAAIADLDRLVDTNPRDRGHRVMRAVCLMLVKSPDRACHDLDTVIDAGPNDVEALNLRAWAHTAVGRVDAALSDLDRLIEIDPGNLGHR